MRKLLQITLRKPVSWLARKLSSSPRKNEIFSSLTQLLHNIRAGKHGYPPAIPFDINTAKFIILSDQHKGAKDEADDFRNTETNYMCALQHYYDEGFTFINLGDCEELWECSPSVVIDKNRLTLLEEAQFQAVGRYHRIFGNHDLEWNYAIQQNLFLRPIFGPRLEVKEGLLLTTSYNEKTFSIFLAHGHQGDRRSDGNAFSKWFVAAIWTPIQRFLEITVDVISESFELVDEHNILMYEWSATQDNLLFISGHTHKPVFASLDHMDRLATQLQRAHETGNADDVAAIEQEIERRKQEYRGKKIIKTMAKPSYFNSGCCCYSDGDLTGIEIEGGFIRLIKWRCNDGKGDKRILEEAPLYYIFEQLGEQEK